MLWEMYQCEARVVDNVRKRRYDRRRNGLKEVSGDRI